jgi:hypothetical protein
MVEAMVKFGYGQVGARPDGPGSRARARDLGMEWEMLVPDDNVYPLDVFGLHQGLAVERQTRGVARAHGGFAVGRASAHSLGHTLPVFKRTPGAHPSIPQIPEFHPLPAGDLAFTPDLQPGSGLDMTLWTETTTAGPQFTAELRAQLTGLALSQDERDWNERLSALTQLIEPGGACNEGTGPAAVLLAQMLIAGTLPAVRRCGVYWVLIEVASRYGEALFHTADKTAATGLPPGTLLPPGQLESSRQARDVLAPLIPALLSRWDIEPPANRLALAALAARFRTHGQAIVDQIATLAAQQDGTTAGSCARIAHQLITGDSLEAFGNARAMYLSNDVDVSYDIDNWLLDPADLAAGILSAQVVGLIARASYREGNTA